MDLRALARTHTERAVQVLAGVMGEESYPPAARVSAAGLLLERGWGKAAQPITGEDGGEITIVIRRLMDEDAAKLVEGRVVKTIDQVVRQSK
jgi:hypothetical protein